jgi:hypothetical protein
MNDKIIMVSDVGAEEAYEAAKDYLKAKEEKAYCKARGEYLRENPEVGTMIRNGKELFYINLLPLYKGKIKVFSPKSVINY